jgi:hypothetical protein
MRKTRENLRAYGGLAAMCTLTPPGVDAGLVWDRSQCTHGPAERCGKRHGRKVLPAPAELWNEQSRKWWSELNRICKQHADRRVKQLGYEQKGGLLLYQWELQGRGVWHIHFVVGLETAVERVWAYEYVQTMRRLAPSKGFGFVDAKPLKSPEPAERVASYLSKYLAKWQDDGSLEVTETVKSAGRTLVSYVSRSFSLRSARSTGTRSPPARPDRDGACAPPRQRGALARPSRRTASNGAVGAPAASPSYCGRLGQRSGMFGDPADGVTSRRGRGRLVLRL